MHSKFQSTFLKWQKKDYGFKQYVEQCRALIWASLQRQMAFHLSLRNLTSSGAHTHAVPIKSIHPLWTFLGALPFIKLNHKRCNYVVLVFNTDLKRKDYFWSWKQIYTNEYKLRRQYNPLYKSICLLRLITPLFTQRVEKYWTICAITREWGWCQSNIVCLPTQY